MKSICECWQGANDPLWLVPSPTTRSLVNYRNPGPGNSKAPQSVVVLLPGVERQGGASALGEDGNIVDDYGVPILRQITPQRL